MSFSKEQWKVLLSLPSYALSSGVINAINEQGDKIKAWISGEELEVNTLKVDKWLVVGEKESFLRGLYRLSPKKAVLLTESQRQFLRTVLDSEIMKCEQDYVPSFQKLLIAVDEENPIFFHKVAAGNNYQ